MLILTVIYLFKLRITNIYISGNNILTDNDIIQLAGIGDYPYTLTMPKSKIKNELESNTLISSVKVKKEKLTIIYIEVTENRPLFYDNLKKKTILMDKKEIMDSYNTPILVNDAEDSITIPESVYNELITSLSKLDLDIISRISEIIYKPNSVDTSLFLLIMNDGNHVYINNERFINLNKYLALSETVGTKKGTFYLDYGNKFIAF